MGLTQKEILRLKRDSKKEYRLQLDIEVNLSMHPLHQFAFNCLIKKGLKRVKSVQTYMDFFINPKIQVLYIKLRKNKNIGRLILQKKELQKMME